MRCSSLLALTLAVAACGGGSAGGAPAAGAGGAGTGTTNGTSCEERDGIRPEDLDATPRPDRATERLALTISRGLTAEQGVYDRLVRDLAAMRRADPSIAQLEFRGIDDGRTLILHTDLGGEAWVAEHPELEALRRRFRAPSPSFPYHWVAFEFGDVFELRRLGKYFERLRGVQEVGTNVLTGDGPTICVAPGTDRWTTYFVDAGGDCPAGCTTVRIVAFTSTAAGALERLGEADPERGGDPRLIEGARRCLQGAEQRTARFVPACRF